VSPAPLDDLLVLDLSRVLAGPYAAMMLADLGARVIKVERPGIGDDTRRWGPPFVGPEGARESTYFLSTNRGKESVALDLKTKRDRETLETLIGRADVLIENFRVGVMDRLGLGPERLEELNPRLVSLSITGFGATGPEADRTGYDQIVQGEGGLMSLTGPTADQPTKVGVPIADIVAGMFGAYGVLAALHEREHSGLGQTVTTSLLAGQIAIHTFQGTRWLVADEVPGPSGSYHPTVCPYGMVPTADGHLIVAVGNEAIWQRFAPLVELDAADERFATNAARVAQREPLHQLIETAMSRRNSADWLALFADHGIPAGEVKTLDHVYGSAQVREQELVYCVRHETLGDIELPGMPLRFSRSPAAAPGPPPTLGQHGDAVRAWLSGEM
jgi:crotonobetainyl-CoA:carnitine CoA-transferase CaiB-like acyl-CoA transferase